MTKPNYKVLILVKKGREYGTSYSSLPKAGLYNSATFLKDALIQNLHIPTVLEVAIDGNDIDRRIVAHKPTTCILEALWVTADKVRELAKLHPKIQFIIRIHSKIPFLSNEGIAIEWIKEYDKIGKQVIVSFNNEDTADDFKNIGIRNTYLPNLYKIAEHCNDEYISILDRIKIKLIELNFLKEKYHHRDIVHVGCFGAIRPLKNQLLQAVAAMTFANKHGRTLYFHINASRVEQKGEEALKNIRALFKHSKHKLIEHPWMPHDVFLSIIKGMDIGMQLSFTESFNIVTADFVYEHTPIIVGEDIDWMNSLSRCNPNHVNDIVQKMEWALSHRKYVAALNLKSLNIYNKEALEVWAKFFHVSSTPIYLSPDKN